MENPRARLTNVHQIEGVLFIQWATWSMKPSTDSSHASQQPEERKLHDVEIELRRNLHYATYDEDQDSIWHFVLAGPDAAKDPTIGQRSSQASEILASHGLKRLSSGSIRATDVAEALNVVQEVYGGSSSEHKQTTTDNNGLAFLTNQSNTTSHKNEAQTVSVAQEIIRIYIAALVGIEKTVSYTIAKAGNWLPIAARTFIPTESLTQLSINQENIQDEPFETFWPLLRNLKVTWLLNGTVVLICNAVALDDVFPSHVSMEQSKDVSEAVLLAPCGFRGFLTNEDAIPGSEAPVEEYAAQWRLAVKQYLAQQGLTLQSPETWCIVCATMPDQLQENFDHPSNMAQIKLPWPRELCLRLNTGDTGGLVEEREQSENGTFRDLLAEVELWVLNKEQREIDLRQERLQKQQDEAAADPEPIEDDDYAHILVKDEGTTDVQSIAGIYPTPPDGPRAQMAAPSDSRPFNDNNHNYIPDAKSPLSTEYRTPKVTFDDNVKSDEPDVEMESYDQMEEDDLFGNSHSDDYADNGVTEDDFSFFDEPGEKTSSNSGQGEIQMAQNSIEGLPTPALETSLKQAEEEPASKKPIPQQHTPESPEWAKDNQSKLATDRGVSEITPEGGNTNDHEADQIHLQETNVFASKYGQKGKFFTEVPKPDTADPSQEVHVRNSIPSLSQANNDHDSDYDSSDDSDMMSDLRNSLPEIEVQDSDQSQKQATYQPRASTTHEELAEIEISTELRDFYESYGSYAQDLLYHLHQLGARSMSGMMREVLTTRPLPSNIDYRYIRLAQIFADQMVYLKELGGGSNRTTLASSHDLYTDNDPTYEAMHSLFPRGTRCSLERLTNIVDDGTSSHPLSKTPNRPQAKRGDASKADYNSPANLITLVEPPRVRTRRGDKEMEISYVALRFWEDLGLCPFAGPKKIVAFCLFPDQEVVRRGAESFLTTMNSTYTSLRLGSHSAGHPAMKGYRDGLLPLPSTDGDDPITLGKICERFGRSLQTLATAKCTIVVYMFADGDLATGIREMCTAFLRLFDAYAGNMKFSSKPSDLVLKVLPIDWIASSVTIAMPRVHDLVRLSKDLYDRCPLENEQGNPYASHSLIEIAEPIPRALDFKLGSEGSADPMRSETFAHVAYCWDQGSTWLTFALTDTLGCHSWTASFCLGPSPDQCPNFKGAVKGILEIVKESILDAHGRAKIVIYKDSAMHQWERQCWMALSKDESLILTILDGSSSLHLVEEPPPIPQFDFSQIPNSIPSTPDTPVPDLSTPKAGEEIDPRARAIDPDEIAWTVVTNRTPHVERNIDPAALFAHGYIIKRDRAVMSLKIVHSMKEVDVRELLTMNQGLICLAKARGFEGELPWHMAVARRAQDGLALF